MKKQKEPRIKNKKRQRSLFTTLMLFSVIPLILAIVIVSATSLYLTKASLETSARETLYIAANNLANHCNQNRISYATAETYYDYIDGLQEQNIEMAIILNYSSSVTSIKNENDYRIREITVNEELAYKTDGSAQGYYDKAVVIDGKVYYAYYMPIYVDNENVGMAFAGELQNHITESVQKIVINFICVAGILVLLFSIIVLVFSKSLATSFQGLNKRIAALSTGDLRVQKVKNNSIRELNNLQQAMELMQNNLSETIGNITTVSVNLVHTISDVTKLSESNSAGAGNILTAMQDLSAATMGMAENVQDISTQMIEIGNCVSDISDSVRSLSTSSEKILLTNNDARDNMNQIMCNSRKSVDAVGGITIQIQETNESISEINKAVEFIISISEQTKLLSLNASIEAARAGEQGRGFAVVAEEIRHLSEQSSEGAEMIKDIAQTIIEKSGKSVEQTKEVQALIKREQDSVEETQNQYNKLGSEIGSSVEQIKSIEQKTRNLTEYREKISDNVQSLSAISEENAAGNQEVNSNIEKILSDVQTVSDNCERMNKIAENLKQSVEYFHK